MNNRFLNNPHENVEYSATGRSERRAANSKDTRVAENNERRAKLESKGWKTFTSIYEGVAFLFKFSFTTVRQLANKILDWIRTKRTDAKEPWIEKIGNETWIAPKEAGIIKRLLSRALRKKRKKRSR